MLSPWVLGVALVAPILATAIMQVVVTRKLRKPRRDKEVD